MKIIFFIIVLVTTTIYAFRLRENLNVLVPNNDVNVRANIKKLLSDDDSDPKEVKEFLEIDRLLKPMYENNEEKLIPSSPQTLFLANLVESEGIKDQNNITDPFLFDTTTTKNHYHKKKRTTVTRTTQGFKEIFEPEGGYAETTFDYEENWINFTEVTTSSYFVELTNLTTTIMNNYNDSSLPWTTDSYNFNTTLFNNISTTTQFTNNFTTSDYNISTNFSTTEPYNNFPNASTTSTSFIFTTPTVFTSTVSEPNPTVNEECLLGSVSKTLKWVNENGALQLDFINSNYEMSNLTTADFSKSKSKNSYYQIKDIEILSLAYNDFNELPNDILNQSSSTLQYLSLMGNNFKFLDLPDSLFLPNLKELDLRNCALTNIKPMLFMNLINLRRLYLSGNNIIHLNDNSFNIPNLENLDLSSNHEDAPIQSPLTMTPNVFSNLKKLKFLDLSHTKLETKSIVGLKNLPINLIGASFCYTELATSDNFLENLKEIKYLDLSGNTQMNFTKNMFSSISNTLERLDIKDANVRNLEWTHPLIKLKSLNLKDNKLKFIDNNSFSHMLILEDLNLSKNSIVNWYTQLFSQNQNLETLNLRENALTHITTAMKDDLFKVRRLAIGKNAFECSCELNDFMHTLFDATKNANLTEIKQDLNIADTQSSSTTIHSISLGMRNYLSPEYDIMSRTYQKYYEQILNSIEALKKNNYSRKSKSLISFMMSMSDAPKSIQTVLFDYDENNEDYQCMNKTLKEQQSILNLIEVCDVLPPNDPLYIRNNDAIIIALSTSIPTVLVVSVLIFIIYWKWFYIRYFFILCKNSAILSFMDDDDGGKEVIVRKTSTNSIDIFLYDVFVSYSDYNRSWVLDEFIPNVERRESINVCLHERDFQVGYGILENIVSCMDRSRCLLLLVSEKFLQSQWCQFEMNLAQHRLLEMRKEKLILVLLEDIPLRKQTKTLKYLMRTKTYLKWPINGTNDEKHLFWKRLRKAIISGKWEYDNYGSTA
ncbi:hypothetical protein PVAND_007251 [Polypedilum vanderplanki]|uniref:TIR domain-containing protein n=1 Tax=Polypedilum vanderplanki TaxID=319348 RepID=A0A9J6C789_POLVA|nr:hypothetical protein PVAND_007251 [Polypedilum vanderplanki]